MYYTNKKTLDEIITENKIVDSSKYEVNLPKDSKSFYGENPRVVNITISLKTDTNQKINFEYHKPQNILGNTNKLEDEYKLYAIYKTRLNPDTPLGKEIPNEVQLKFKNNPKETKDKVTKPEVPPTIQTGGKRFRKIGMDDEKIDYRYLQYTNDFIGWHRKYIVQNLDSNINMSTPDKEFKGIPDAVFVIKHSKEQNKPSDMGAENIENLKWTENLLEANKIFLEIGYFFVRKDNNGNFIPTSKTNMPQIGEIVYLKSFKAIKDNDSYWNNPDIDFYNSLEIGKMESAWGKYLQGDFEIQGLPYSHFKTKKWDKNTNQLVDDKEIFNHYALKEVKAPEGYALNTQAIDFKVDETSYCSYTDPNKKSNARQLRYALSPIWISPSLKIRNKKMIIPQTGGFGTLVFTMIGSALMIEGIIRIRKNKKNNK